MNFVQKYSFILELSTKFYFWNITDSRVGDYEQYQYRYHSKGNLIAISNLSKFSILMQPFLRKLHITIFQSQKSHNYALNNDTSHIIYQNEGFFTTNTMVKKSERFAHAIRKFDLFEAMADTQFYPGKMRFSKKSNSNQISNFHSKEILFICLQISWLLSPAGTSTRSAVAGEK